MERRIKEVISQWAAVKVESPAIHNDFILRVNCSQRFEGTLNIISTASVTNKTTCIIPSQDDETTHKARIDYNSTVKQNEANTKSNAGTIKYRTCYPSYSGVS